MKQEINEYLQSEMDQMSGKSQSVNLNDIRDFDIAVMDWIKKNACDFSVQWNKSYDHNEILS
jgi:hypothetical protein